MHANACFLCFLSKNVCVRFLVVGETETWPSRPLGPRGPSVAEVCRNFAARDVLGHLRAAFELKAPYTARSC